MGENVPSEECFWNLEQYLRPHCSNTQRSDGPNKDGNLPTSPSNEHSATGEHRDHPHDVSIPMGTFEFSKPEEILDKLRNVRNENIHTSFVNSVFVFTSWIILSLSLPATVAGYIGCFTLVSGSRGNGSLIWLLLEAVLSIIRILLWAWNPSFDERTDDSDYHQPLRERRQMDRRGHLFVDFGTSIPRLDCFIHRPSEPFQISENLALYFALGNGKRAEQKHLYLTALDINERNAVTLHWEEEFEYIDTVITLQGNCKLHYNPHTLQPATVKDHPWMRNRAILFDDLSRYYFSITPALAIDSKTLLCNCVRC